MVIQKLHCMLILLKKLMLNTKERSLMVPFLYWSPKQSLGDKELAILQTLKEI